MRAILDGIFYALVSYGATAFSTMAGLLVRLWISPTVFGATNLVNGIQSYFGSYNGLYRNAIDREVPVYLGRGETSHAEEVLRVSYTLLFISALIESALFIGIGLYTKEYYLKLAWWTVAFVNFTDTFSTADRITLKATIRFHAHNAALILGSLCNAIVLIGSSWLWGYLGYFAGLAAGSFLQFIISRRALRRNWHSYLSFGLSPSVIKRVFSVGIFIALYSLSIQLLMTMDRYFVLGYLSLTDLGYYSLGSMMMVRVYILPMTLIGSYMPRMMTLLGAGQLEQARYSAERLQRSSVLISAFTAGMLLVFIGPFVSWLFPEYMGAIPAIEVMAFGSYFLGANATTFQLHIGLQRVQKAIMITILGNLFAVGLNFGLVRYGLIGVAIATNIAIGFYVLMMNWSGQGILRMGSLTRWFFIGFGLLIILYGLLYLVGREAAIAWLVIYSIVGAWYLTRLYLIKWHEMPKTLRHYFFNNSDF